jgi:hypothetical protein
MNTFDDVWLSIYPRPEKREWNSARQMSASKEDINQAARQLRHWESGVIEWLVTAGIQLGANDGAMSDTTGKVANSSLTYRRTEFATKPIQETQRHGDNNTKYNILMSQQGWDQ